MCSFWRCSVPFSHEPLNRLRLRRVWRSSRLTCKCLRRAATGRSLFPHVALVAAVLYTKPDASNRRYQDPKMLLLATRIGDLLASVSEQGRFPGRLNDDRDAYMWLEATGYSKKTRCGAAPALAARTGKEHSRACGRRRGTNRPPGLPPFIGTAPNHFALWASTVYLGGRVFAKSEWVDLGARVLHRFATEEQSPDGYWGEHERSLPTPGYDYNTYASLALYAELSHDPSALAALRRGLDFHKYFTYPDLGLSPVTYPLSPIFSRAGYR